MKARSNRRRAAIPSGQIQNLSRAEKRASARPCVTEWLENRMLMSAGSASSGAVTDTWIASTSGTWSNAQNWSLGAVPTAGENVVINTPGIAVTVDVTANIANIQSQAALDITNSLTVTSGASSVTGALTIGNGAGLVSQGAGTSFNASGATAVTNASVYAKNGAMLALPALMTFAGAGGSSTLEADGTGSLLSLPNLSNVDGSIYINAQTGATISLPLVTSLTTGSHQLYATSGGAISIPQLAAAALTGIHTDGTGTITTGQLTSLTFNSGIRATGGSMPDYGKLTDLDNTSIYAQSGSTVTLPAVTRYSGPNGSPTLEADGTGSVLSLPNLSNVDGSFNVNAQGGGTVSLPLVADLTSGINRLNASGGGSISIPKLTTAMLTLIHTDGTGTVTTGQLTSLIDNSQIVATGGSTPDYGKLTYLANSDVYAQGGSTVTLPGVTRYPDGSGTSILEADGAGSVVSLPNSTNADGILQATATAGGVASLPLVTSLVYGGQLYATSGGTISIPKLTTAASTFIHTDGTGTVTTGQLTSLTNNSQIRATGGSTPDYGKLTDLDQSSVYVQSGSTVTLPGVTRYAGLNGSPTLTADGKESKLSLPNLSNADGSFYVNATAGGLVSLPLVTSLTAGNHSLTTFGGGTISMPELAVLTNGSISAQTGGTVNAGSTLTLIGSHATIDQGSTVVTHALTLLVNSILDGSGSIAGDVINSGGIVIPGGGSPATFTISGDYIQTPCGILELFVGGAAAGSGYQQLIVTGAATLGGTLRMSLYNGYVPPLKSQFQVVAAGSSNGFFTTLQSTQVSSNLELDTLYASSGPSAGVSLRADSSQGPSLVSTTIGDGSAQRSEIGQLTVKFSTAVMLSPGAFTLALQNTGGSGTNSSSCVSPTDATTALGQPTSTDGGITWVVPILPNTAFSDKTGSLTDGIYTFTVHGADVTANGLLLSGWDQTTTFHRLFGDINGDKTVSNADYFFLRKAFNTSTGQTGFNSAFDFNGDGSIGNTDYFQFRKRFLMTFTY